MSNPTLNWEVIAVTGNIDDVDNWILSSVYRWCSHEASINRGCLITKVYPKATISEPFSWENSDRESYIDSIDCHCFLAIDLLVIREILGWANLGMGWLLIDINGYWLEHSPIPHSLSTITINIPLIPILIPSHTYSPISLLNHYYWL